MNDLRRGDIKNKSLNKYFFEHLFNPEFYNKKGECSQNDEGAKKLNIPRSNSELMKYGVLVKERVLKPVNKKFIPKFLKHKGWIFNPKQKVIGSKNKNEIIYLMNANFKFVDSKLHEGNPINWIAGTGHFIGSSVSGLFLINSSELVKKRDVYLDPESIYLDPSFYYEFGHSFFVRGGIPIEVIRVILVFPKNEKEPHKDLELYLRVFKDAKEVRVYPSPYISIEDSRKKYFDKFSGFRIMDSSLDIGPISPSPTFMIITKKCKLSDKEIINFLVPKDFKKKINYKEVYKAYLENSEFI